MGILMAEFRLAIEKLKSLSDNRSVTRIELLKSVYADTSRYGNREVADRNVDREAWLYAKPEVLDVYEEMQQHRHNVYAE